MYTKLRLEVASLRKSLQTKVNNDGRHFCRGLLLKGKCRQKVFKQTLGQAATK